MAFKQFDSGIFVSRRSVSAISAARREALVRSSLTVRMVRKRGSCPLPRSELRPNGMVSLSPTSRSSRARRATAPPTRWVMRSTRCRSPCSPFAAAARERRRSGLPQAGHDIAALKPVLRRRVADLS